MLVIGLVVLIAVRIVEGFYANLAYERRYLEWRGDPLVTSGLNWHIAAFGVVLWLGIVPLTLYRFTVSKPWELITRFPMEKQVFTPVQTRWRLVRLAREHGAGVFDGVTHSIRTVLDGLEVVLVAHPVAGRHARHRGDRVASPPARESPSLPSRRWPTSPFLDSGR